MKSKKDSVWRLRWEALRELLSRYKAIWAFHWASRDENAHHGYSPAEAEFLPGSLAIQESPPSPLPRMAMWCLMGFAFLALLWSIVGHLDIVVAGQGQFVTSLRSKSIQPMELGTVQAIHVKDGDLVQEGDVLVELDSTVSTADGIRLQAELKESAMQFMVHESLNRSIHANRSIFEANQLVQQLLSTPKQASQSVPKSWIDQAQVLFEQRWADFLVQKTKHQWDMQRRETEMKSLQQTLNKLEEVLPLSKQRAQDLRWLHEQGAVSRHQFLEREQVAIETQAELATQRSKHRELELGQTVARQDYLANVAELRRQSVQTSREQLLKAQTAWTELEKANHRLELQTLRSPIQGMVQQLAIHTIGGVVTSAQTLMVVVPKEEVLELEVRLNNRDSGFVRAGQLAKVKVDAFPYTRHGILQGRVVHVSRDAVPSQDNKELHYVARVRLDPADDTQKALPLLAGMTAVVELHTGSRRVIDYLLSPLREYTSEAMRER